MGFNLLKKLRLCCQGDSDNYFDKSSYKNESRVSTEDFLKKRDVEVDSKKQVEEIVADESVISNVKFTNSILNDDKISEVKRVEIDEASILSDKNINQLRQRNPRLNRFDNDVIRLSLRKSLYANNLEEDLENFLKEQQKIANKYDRKENPYTISDMRELYDMINNITLKEKKNSKIPSASDDKPTIIDTEKPSQENDKVDSEPNNINSEPIEEITKSNSEVKKDSITDNIIPNKNNSLKINTNLPNYIPRKNKTSSHENNHNSTDSSIKDTNNNEPLNLLDQTKEQNSYEVVGSSKNDKRSNSNLLTKSSILNYSEILYQTSNNKNSEQSHNIQVHSPIQNYSEVMCNSPEDDTSSHNILCSSPQQSYSEMICESPEDEYSTNNHTLLCNSPTDESNDNHTVLCSSPQGSYSEMVCESPVDESPVDEIDSRSMLFTSPEQKFSNQIVQSSPEPTDQSSPKTLSKAIRRSTGYSFNSMEAFVGTLNMQNKETSSISTHDKDLLLSQLKMTELSKKNDNSLLKNSLFGSFPEESSKMKPYQSKLSQNSDSVQSVYSYENIENVSSRKITKRGIRILRSRDTLDRQRPVNIKTRRRKALLIGINYVNKPYELHGCINDAHYMYGFLKENYDFKEENCKIMTDDAEDESLIPTKKNIIEAMKWLVCGAKSGDSLFFHYSGHGLSFKDSNGDEIDGLDESILPVDYETNGVILDDEIHDILVKPLPKDCLLTALADCCHSGTVLDLPYVYNAEGELEDVDDMDEDHKEISKEYLSNEIYQKNKMVQELVSRNTSLPPINLSLEERQKIDAYAKQVRKSKATVIQYSSCRDNEISADERANGNTYGALCNAFVSTLTSLILEEKTISYCDLLKELRCLIQKRYGQTPQLSTGRPMDVHQPFEL